MTEPSNIARFTGNTEKARDHVTLPIEDMARILAEAEDLGYRRALIDGRVADHEANRLRTNHWQMFQIRVNLYRALWHSKIKSGSVAT